MSEVVCCAERATSMKVCMSFDSLVPRRPARLRLDSFYGEGLGQRQQLRDVTFRQNALGANVAYTKKNA